MPLEALAFVSQDCQVGTSRHWRQTARASGSGEEGDGSTRAAKLAWGRRAVPSLGFEYQPSKEESRTPSLRPVASGSASHIGL